MHDQDLRYRTGDLESFHEGFKEFYFMSWLQWCRMASWCVIMIDRMVRDRSSTNHKIMFPVLAMASSYAKMAVIQSRPRRAYAGSILSSLKTFQREDVRKIGPSGSDVPHLLDNGGAHCHTRRVTRKRAFSYVMRRNERSHAMVQVSLATAESPIPETL